MFVRKKDIIEWYKKRDTLTIEESESLFCNGKILFSIDEKFRDGLKLCAYLILEKIGTEKAWNLIRNFVVNGKITKSVCLNLGTVLQKAYKDALEAESSEGIVTRSEVAHSIFKPLMEHCILVKRKCAEKFCLILRGATIERDALLSKMLFDVSTRVVWRYLNAKNSQIRMGAFYAQLNVFPPISSDPIVTSDYTNKHCEAFLKALSDPTVDICLQAIEGVCEVVSLWFAEISEVFIDKILNELIALAEDESPIIRAAVYHGLRHFQGCAKGVLKFEALLKHICKKGILDSSERVRCNVFRLLNAVFKMNFKIVGQPTNEYILPLEDVLHRLDYEESEAVELEIARCIYLNVFSNQMSNEIRYKALNNICRINRAAGLDFHRLLYDSKITPSKTILSHLVSILTVGVHVLRTVIAKKKEMEIESDRLMNGKKNNNALDLFDIKTSLDRFKDVIDCIVVCYSTLRYNPAFDGNVTEAQLLCRLFSEIACDIITNFEEQHLGLVDSAFFILSLVQKAGVHAANIKNIAIKMLRSGQLNPRYLEVFALTDMNELLGIFNQGLAQFEKLTFEAEKNPRKRRLTKTTDFAKPEVVIRAIMDLFSSPICMQYIVEKFDHYISSFCDTFDRICDKFMARLENDKDLNMSLFVECWDLRTILTIVKFNREAFIEIDDKPQKNGRVSIQSNLSTPQRRSAVIITQIEAENRVDPLVEECSWVNSHLRVKPELAGNADFVEQFYSVVELYLRSYRHQKKVINSALSLVNKICRMGKEHRRNRTINQPYKSCLQAGEHAIEFSKPDEPAVNLSIFEEKTNSHD